MIGLAFVYAAAGAVFATYAILSATDHRWRNALLWGLLAVSMWFGDRLGDLGNGVLVAAIVLVAVLGINPAKPAELAAPKGDGLFAIALIVPAVALGGTLYARWFPGLMDPKQATLISLVFGVIVALAVAFIWLRPRPLTPLREGLRLMDTIGSITLLPPLLAALGGIFTLAKVGPLVGGYAGAVLPDGSLIAAVLAYTFGMFVLTVLMGNAFAAFPIMVTAIGIPVLIHQHHGNPAAVAALGMLCGFCGTLSTPMAANFTLLPAALLELKDRYAVIKAQVPTALPLWVACTAMLYGLAF
ncbi:DUF979 domain-containing protein [Sphingomonas antarctica]|uniref:5-oxoproline transporter, DUF979 family subunit n=1 Tax=Sphingomonas antarctica TaxID=2040274 RepID=UPI0039ECB508